MTATYQYLVDTGTVSEDTADLLSDVQSEWKSALGSKLNVAASTPQGTMIAAEVIARADVMKNNAELANMINPQLAVGTFLDAVCAFLAVERGDNKSTFVYDVTITGTSTTVIPAGSRVETSNGDVFSTVTAVTIPSSGTTTAELQSQEYGSITVPTETLTIVDGTIGWGSCAVTSSSSITYGTTALTDGQLKLARNNQLATLGKGSVEAITSAISAVANVDSVLVIQNNTGSVGTVNGVVFTLPNATWVCVSGSPAQADVASALWEALNGVPTDFGTSSGTPVGDTTNGVAVTDPTTNLSYYVKWVTPTMYDAYVKISVSQGTSAQTPDEVVANSMVNYANGQIDGFTGLVVGASVSAFELSAAVGVESPGLYIKSVKVACVLAGAAAPVDSDYVYEFPIGPFQQAVLTVGRVAVTTL